MTKKRILIVDDDVGAARLLKAGLEKDGVYEVRDESKGRHGLSAALEFRPDAVLLDVCMPDLDGGQVAFQIQGDKNLKHTPIIFLTSIVSEQEAGHAGLSSGGFQFLSKPVSISKLLERLDAIFAAKAC